MTYISCFSDFAFYFYYYFMENCHTWIIISKWQNDLHTNTSRSVWPILYGLMIKMLQYKMYPAGKLAVLRQLLFFNISRKNKKNPVFIAPACSRVRYRRPIFRPSVRLSTFMSTFDIYVKVSILINYKTKQQSILAWNISLTSWLCDIGVRFSVCLSIRPSVCQHLCWSSTFMSKLVF